MMKYLKKFFSLCLVLALCLSLGTVALAAPVAEATIDASRTGSLDIYKYDFTNAAKDGVWDSSYVSTGVYDQAVNDALGNAVRAGDTDNSGDLGNGETSYGYAVKGVEFTYLRVADIVQFTESAADGATSNHVEVLYGIDKTNGADLLAAHHGVQRATHLQGGLWPSLPQEARVAAGDDNPLRVHDTQNPVCGVL